MVAFRLGFAWRDGLHEVRGSAMCHDSFCDVLVRGSVHVCRDAWCRGGLAD